MLWITDSRGSRSDNVDRVAPGVPSLVVWMEAFNTVPDCRRDNSTFTTTSHTVKLGEAVEGCDCDVLAEDEVHLPLTRGGLAHVISHVTLNFIIACTGMLT